MELTQSFPFLILDAINKVFPGSLLLYALTKEEGGKLWEIPTQVLGSSDISQIIRIGVLLYVSYLLGFLINLLFSYSEHHSTLRYLEKLKKDDSSIFHLIELPSQINQPIDKYYYCHDYLAILSPPAHFRVYKFKFLYKFLYSMSLSTTVLGLVFGHQNPSAPFWFAVPLAFIMIGLTFYFINKSDTYSKKFILSVFSSYLVFQYEKVASSTKNRERKL